MGRHSEMERLVAKVRVSPEARQRLRVVLCTLSCELSVKEGCARLGVCRARFQILRDRALEFAGESLEARSPGRPRRAVAPETEMVRVLRQQIAELEREQLRLEAELEIARSDPGRAVDRRLAAKGARP